MHNFFSTSLRRAIPVVAVAATLSAGSVAQAKPVQANLRVEAAGKALDPGTTYATDTTKFKTDTRMSCGGSGQTKTVKGATAMGLLGTAAAKNENLRPLGISDKFSFSLTVCGVGKYFGFESSSYWLYKVNHKAAEVGGDAYKLKKGDQVLWFFQDTAAKVNTGDELVLQAPSKGTAGKSVKVTVWAYDINGKRKAAAGATVNGQTTDASGHATITLGTKSLRLRATRGSDIASAPVSVKVPKK